MAYLKKYLRGSGRQKDFDNGGHIIEISIEESDFQSIPTFTTKNGDVFRTFRLSSKKEKGEYGDTHGVFLSYKEGEEPSNFKAGESGSKKTITKENDGFFD